MTNDSKPFSDREKIASRRIVLFKRGLLAAALSIFLFGGCAGYQVGTGGLFNQEIKTVHVPMVEADTYRSGLGEKLTEAICKKITERTPYDMASASKADSVLIVRLTAENQYISALDAWNNTRQKNLVWQVSAVWKDRRNQSLAELEPIPLSDLGVTMNVQGYLVPETGQSGATAQQELVEKIANQVVGLMESQW